MSRRGKQVKLRLRSEVGGPNTVNPPISARNLRRLTIKGKTPDPNSFRLRKKGN